MSDQEIKPCPNCRSDDTEVIGDNRRLCYECGFCCHDQYWNALPRREDFHTELMDYAVKIEERAYNAVYHKQPGPPVNGYLLLLEVVDELVQWAKKYAPAKPEKGVDK